jgi:hypothetical protein
MSKYPKKLQTSKVLTKSVKKKRKAKKALHREKIATEQAIAKNLRYFNKTVKPVRYDCPSREEFLPIDPSATNEAAVGHVDAAVIMGLGTSAIGKTNQDLLKELLPALDNQPPQGDIINA